jgi:Domain of unknown function (DUF5668)/B-box zinc finger
MNCLNHPDVAAVAYCQNCGKPLCSACMRTVWGVVYCEPCLAARLSVPPGTVPANLTGLHAHPVLAGLLGFIPGVGAMYNGQFVKALAHVLIFAVFVSLSDKSTVFGLLVAAWVFYQVFDAAQTAKARRDGLPLPNPFGLNDLGTRLGMTPTPPASPYVSGFAPPPASGPVPGPPQPVNPGQDPGAYSPGYTASYAAPPTPGTTGTGVPGSQGYGTQGYGTQGYSGQPYSPPVAMDRLGNKHPMGAIVLIGVGVILLLHTLGIFEDEWIGRAWPIFIIAVGAWLLYRRTRDLPRGGGQ